MKDCFSNSNYKVGIVGCGGFIGSHLLERLLNDTNFLIMGIDLDDSKIQEHVNNPRVVFQKGDYSSAFLYELVGQCDVVFSLASLCNPAQYNTIPHQVIRSNFMAPLELVDACTKSQTWLVQFSTSEVYGCTIASLIDDLHIAQNPHHGDSSFDDSNIAQNPLDPESTHSTINPNIAQNPHNGDFSSDGSDIAQNPLDSESIHSTINPNIAQNLHNDDFSFDDSRTAKDLLNSNILLREDESPLIMGAIHNQRWCYATAKQLLERYIYAAGEEQNLKWTIIRPFNFLGPRMDYIPGVDGEGIPRVLSCFMDALLRDESLKLVDAGKNLRCFTYIDDVIEALFAIIEHSEAAQNEIFNIGHQGNELTIAELAYKMAKVYGKITNKPKSWSPEILNVSSYEFYGKGYEDSDRRLPDISKAKNKLNWVATTGIDETLEKTIAWYVEYYKEKINVKSLIDESDEHESNACVACDLEKQSKTIIFSDLETTMNDSKIAGDLEKFNNIEKSSEVEKLIESTNFISAQPKVSIFMPSYNVANHLENTINRIPKESWAYIENLWIINDGSTDNTLDVAERLKAIHAVIKVVDFGANRGYGNVVKEGLKLGNMASSDYLVCLHGDGQYPPESLDDFIKKMQEDDLDLLQGSRIASGTAISGGMPLYKYVANRSLTMLENQVMNLSLTDYHSGYLCYSKKFLESVNIDVLSGSFDVDLELIASAKAHSLKIAEAPIPTYYGEEISHVKPIQYGFRCLGVMYKYLRGVYSK